MVVSRFDGERTGLEPFLHPGPAESAAQSDDHRAPAPELSQSTFKRMLYMYGAVTLSDAVKRIATRTASTRIIETSFVWAAWPFTRTSC